MSKMKPGTCQNCNEPWRIARANLNEMLQVAESKLLINVVTLQRNIAEFPSTEEHPV